MTRYEVGFLSKCAEMHVDPRLARALCKKALSMDDVSDFAHKAIDRTGDVVSGTVDSVKADPINNGVIPGLAGVAGGAVLGSLFGGDDPRKRRRNMIIASLLGGGAALAAKGMGYGSWLPKVNGGKVEVPISSEAAQA